jgi:hypothetical protein
MDLLCARVTTVCMVVCNLEGKKRENPGNKKDVQVEDSWAVCFRGLVRHRRLDNFRVEDTYESPVRARA